MFGMILKFQAFLEKLKQNKRVWFTTLTAVSLLGIFATISYLNTTTSRAAQNLYEATSANYSIELDSKINGALESITIFGTALLENPNFTATLGNQNNIAGINEQLKNIAAKINKPDQTPLALELYNKDGIKIASSLSDVKLSRTPTDSKLLERVLISNEFKSGIEYDNGEVYFRAFFPIGNGVLETKKSLNFLFDEYMGRNEVFQVLMDKDFLDMKNVQQYPFKKIGKSEISIQSKVNDDFLVKIAELNFDQILEKKYILTKENFILAKPIMNVDNKRIGMILISEDILQDGSLPHMTKSITNGITSAALGLVVALLVLMI
jgi:hypothetical protein